MLQQVFCQAIEGGASTVAVVQQLIRREGPIQPVGPSCAELEDLVQQLGKAGQRERVEAVFIEVSMQVELIHIDTEHSGCRLQEGSPQVDGRPAGTSG